MINMNNWDFILPPPPLSFDQEMERKQAIIEELIPMPDFGLAAHLNKNDYRNATEVNMIANLKQAKAALKLREANSSHSNNYRD